MAEVEDTQAVVASGTLPRDSPGERGPAPHPCPATHRPAQPGCSPTRLHSDFSTAGGLCRGPGGNEDPGHLPPAVASVLHPGVRWLCLPSPLSRVPDFRPPEAQPSRVMGCAWVPSSPPQSRPQGPRADGQDCAP